MCASHDAHADSLCIVMSCQPPTGLRRMRRNRSATQMSGNMEQCFLSICCYCVSPPPPHGTNSRSLRAGTVCGHDCLCRLPVSHDFRSCLPVGLYMSAHVPIPRHGFPDLLFLCGISDECIFYLMTVTFVSLFSGVLPRTVRFCPFRAISNLSHFVFPGCYPGLSAHCPFRAKTFVASTDG